MAASARGDAFSTYGPTGPTSMGPGMSTYGPGATQGPGMSSFGGPTSTYGPGRGGAGHGPVAEYVPDNGNGACCDQMFSPFQGSGGGNMPKMSYVGNGVGEYTVETNYKYVGKGSGEFDLLQPQMPGQRKDCLCIFIPSCMGVLLLLPLLAFCVLQPSTQLLTTTPPPEPALVPGEAQANSAMVTSPAFDCDSGTVMAWTSGKTQWCCKRPDPAKGCPTTATPEPCGPPPAPFSPLGECMHCENDAGSVWKAACNTGTKKWSCGGKGYRRGHYTDDCGSAACSGEPPLLGAVCINRTWMAAVATGAAPPKRHAGMAAPSGQAPPPAQSIDALPAPYDCDSEYSNWETSWAEGKQSWCCTNKHMGCH